MGSFIDSKNVIYGVMDQNINSQKFCTAAGINKEIKKEAAKGKTLYNCTQLVDNDRFKVQIEDKCKAKNSCDLSLKDWWNPSLTTEEDTLIDGTGACNKKAIFFVQSPCLISKSM